jgi:hypothetical protein
MLNVFWSLVYNLNKSFLRIEYISGLVPTVAGFGRLSETRMPLCNQCRFIAAMIGTTGMPLRNTRGAVQRAIRKFSFRRNQWFNLSQKSLLIPTGIHAGALLIQV